jgi:serine/threonine protein kinase
MELNSFEIRNQIGQGSFGKIYRGIVKQTGEPVAMKVER